MFCKISFTFLKGGTTHNNKKPHYSKKKRGMLYMLDKGQWGCLLSPCFLTILEFLLLLIGGGCLSSSFFLFAISHSHWLNRNKTKLKLKLWKQQKEVSV
jgi:hypothetical protein